jgi:hypothetical protein
MPVLPYKVLWPVLNEIMELPVLWTKVVNSN